MRNLIEDLRWQAARLPTDGPPVVQQAGQLAQRAVEAVEEAVKVDPTLIDADRCRGIDLLTELLRQLKPLARQVVVELERRRLVEAGATAEDREVTRLGRTNKVAPEELEALSRRCTVIAADITAAALPDWNTPQRILERSERLLPSDRELEEIAGRLRRAVKASLDLSHPAPEAVRLAGLANQIVAVFGNQPTEAGR